MNNKRGSQINKTKAIIYN